MRTPQIAALSILLLFALPSPGEAGMVRLSVVGNVVTPLESEPGPESPFNLAGSDTVGLTAEFDESLLPSGADKELVFGQGGNAADGTLRFEIGDLTFTESDDADFSDPDMNLPSITLDGSGQLQSVDFRARDTNGADSFNSASLAFDGSGGLFGEWDPDSATTTRIPVPSSLKLMVPALFSVWFFRSRQSRRSVSRRRAKPIRQRRSDTGGIPPALGALLRPAS